MGLRGAARFEFFFCQKLTNDVRTLYSIEIGLKLKIRTWLNVKDNIKATICEP